MSPSAAFAVIATAVTLGALVQGAVGLGLGLVGIMVLVAVLLTWRVFALPRRRPVLAGVGVVSGVAGTATSIGGPPLALVYTDVSGPQLRATMAAYFVGGGLLSLVGLALAHELTRREGLWALGLAPFAGRTRNAVLVVCACSGLTLVVRSLLGAAG